MIAYWIGTGLVVIAFLAVLHRREEIKSDPYNNFLEIDPSTEKGRERQRMLIRAHREDKDRQVEELA